MINAVMIMYISKDEYSKMTKRHSPSSPTLKNTIFAFLSGGFICAFAEGLTQWFKAIGLKEEEYKALVLVILIGITALLTALGIFDNIAKYAGAGTAIPITGFANSVVSPALEFQSEGYILGTAANMFKIAGPVIVFGCGSALIYGLIYFIAGKI